MTRILLAVLAAGVMAAAGACGEPGPRTVEIIVRHSRFNPAVIDARPGESIRFVVRNLDPIDHEFILGDMEVQRRHEDGTEPHHGAVPGEVSVPAGAMRSTTYTFGSAPVPFGCHLPGHWDYGMRGSVRMA
jgi:uncharacterized cupredoxin-like copper-binding protein